MAKLISEPSHLPLPIYLNQQYVLDSLAIIEDGFSTMSEVKTSATGTNASSKQAQAGMGSPTGVSFLSISIGGGKKESQSSSQTQERTQERVHTPTSLFSKLRILMLESDVIQKLENVDQIEVLRPGSIVEFDGRIMRNPLLESLEAIKQVGELALKFARHSGQGKGKGKSAGVDGLADVMLMIDILLADLVRQGTVDFIASIESAKDLSAVISADVDHFVDRDAGRAIDGEYKIIAKVIQAASRDSKRSVRLLRRSSLGRLDASHINQLVEGIEELAAKFDIPKMRLEIGSPVVHVIPICIFT